MEEGRMGEDTNGGDEAREGETSLHPLAPTYLQFRRDREVLIPKRCTRFALFGFKIFFCLIGLWGHQAWNYILRVVFSSLCLYQAAFSIFAPDFTPCANYGTKEIFYGVASVAAIISYFAFIISFMAAKRKESALVSPSQSTADVHSVEVFLLFIAFFIVMVSAPIIFHSFLISNTFVTTGVVALCLAHLASVSTCHIFAISSLALGTLTQDTFRHIKNIQNGSLDDIISIHEDLCVVVFNTVSAYSVWFVLHWFTYGASVLFGAILISEEVASKASAKCIAYNVFISKYARKLTAQPQLTGMKAIRSEIVETYPCSSLTPKTGGVGLKLEGLRSTAHWLGFPFSLVWQL